jgi:uncharacterized damage-inducible protein DinB
MSDLRSESSPIWPKYPKEWDGSPACPPNAMSEVTRILDQLHRVLHIAVWISVPTRRIEGAEMPTLPPDQDWPAAPQPTEAGWRQALDRLAQAQQNLEEAVRTLTDDRLREKVLGDVPYSIYTMLHGVVQHNLYHAGQIALLKKAAL